MKRQFSIITIAVILVIFSIIVLAGSYLALHDIYRDYVSPKVLQEQTLLKQGALPAWTECHLEWQFIEIGFGLIVLSQIIILSIFAWYVKNNKGLQI